MRDKDNQSEIVFREDARATKASGFCMDDSHDLNKKEKEGSSAQRFLRDEDNQSEIAFREDARAQLNVPNSHNHITSVLSQRTFLSRTLKKRLCICSPKLFNSRGSVLIEFSVCMPILIILLFYINDLMRLKRYYSQTEFVAQQMANILQNISQKRGATDSSQLKITANDIRYAVSLAHLSIFPGKTEFLTGINASDLGYRPLGFIYCVKGNSDSTASVLWGTRYKIATGEEISPLAVGFGTGAVNRSNVKKLSHAAPSEIYPTLKIEKDQIKIIIECTLWTNRSSIYKFTDGTPFSSLTNSQAFGLRLFKISPPKTRDGYNNVEAFFHSAIIFTPKPGLFDETAPV